MTGTIQEHHPATRRARWIALGCVALALVPIGVVVVATFDQWHIMRATSDQALIELQIRDVGTRAVLVGPYSRFGWYHPGPALFYLFAVPYRLLGAGLIAVPLTALALNAACVVSIGWLGRRRGGLVLMALLLIGTLLLIGALGGSALRDVWNPIVTVLPLVVLVLVAWSALEGDGWALPVAVGVGSFLVQAHVGYAGAVGVLLVWAVVGLVVRSRRDLGSLAPTLVAAAVVGAVLWALPAVEQFTHHPGNLGLVLHFGRDPSVPVHGLADGWHVVAHALSWRMPWATGATPFNAFVGEVALAGPAAFPAGLLALACAGIVAGVRGEWRAVRLDVTVGLTLVAATISFGRLSGPMFPYLVVWVWGPAMLVWIGAVWSLWCAVAAPARARATRVALPVLVGLLGLAAVVVAAGAASVEVVRPDQAAATRRFSAAARRAVADGRGAVVLDAFGEPRARSVGVGLALELERHGIPIEVPPDQGLAYGADRTADGGSVRARLAIAPPDLVADTPDSRGWELLARARLGPEQDGDHPADLGLYRIPG